MLFAFTEKEKHFFIIYFMDKWLELIPNKKILNIKLDNVLSNMYNKQTTLDTIIIFDIEFFRYLIGKKQVVTINEMGGIILTKIQNVWVFYAIFHLNLEPIIKDIDKYYLLLSDTNTTSIETYEIIKNNEKIFLPEHNIGKLNENEIIKKYNIKYKNDEQKKIKKIKYMIKLFDFKFNNKLYNLMKENINMILNDKLVKFRTIKYTNLFLKLTNKIFSNSFLIIKGLEDIKALKNHSSMLKIKSGNINNYFDIAIYNNYLFKKCNSAELEKTYNCLYKNNDKYYNILNRFTEFKSHNPLIDSYLTWKVYNYFLLNPLKKTQI